MGIASPPPDTYETSTARSMRQREELRGLDDRDGVEIRSRDDWMDIISGLLGTRSLEGGREDGDGIGGMRRVVISEYEG